MKRFFFSLLLCLSFILSKGESITGWYKKYFRGIEVSGFSNNSFKAIEAGIVLRNEKWMFYHSVKYYSDESYNIYGLNGLGLWLFPVSKSLITPDLQYSVSVNHANSKSDIEIHNSIVNEASVSLGGGLLIEINKYFQIGTALTYEMIGVFGQKVYFNWRPLVTLKYEFRFN